MGGIKRKYDPGFKPKRVMKAMIGMAARQGHQLQVISGVERQGNRTEVFGVECQRCLQVARVEIKHNAGKIKMVHFDPVNDRCLTEAEVARVKEGGHEWEGEDDEGVPICKHCGGKRKAQGEQSVCTSLESIFINMRDDPKPLSDVRVVDEPTGEDVLDPELVEQMQEMIDQANKNPELTPDDRVEKGDQ